MDMPQPEYLVRKPDRTSDCKEVLEGPHIELVEKAVTEGWTEKEVAFAMLIRSAEHLALVSTYVGEEILKILSKGL